MIAAWSVPAFAGLSLASLLTLASWWFIMPGCSSSVGHEEYSRVVELSATAVPLQGLSARTYNGFIAIRGAETGEYKATVTIRAYAATCERARELAEATKASLEPRDGQIVFKLEKPRLDESPVRDSIAWDFQATVPSRTPLDLQSYNGRIAVEQMTATVRATTHNGALVAKNVQGPLLLATYNGSIDVDKASAELHGKSRNGHVCCRDVAGPILAESYNGRVQVACSKDAPKACHIALKSHNGSIDLTLPSDASASARVFACNGRIYSDLPITVVEQTGTREMVGTIGDGQGRLDVQTHNGSVKIRQMN